MSQGNLALQTQEQWEKLAFNSHYQTAVEVQKLLRRGDAVEAMAGLEALIEAMGRSERQAIRSQLIRLMTHIVKWKCQPERRSTSWAITIFSARQEIEDSQEEIPSLNRAYLESIWDKCFAKAVKAAEIEMGKRCEILSLSWKEVFEDEYLLNEEDDRSS
jgi:hypothetical protein